MIKCLHLLFFVVASQAFVIDDIQETQRSISRPLITSVNFIAGVPVLAFTVSWNPVTSTDSNPILGYRLIVSEEIWPNWNQYKTIQQYVIHGAAKNSIAFARMKRGLVYEVQVQAFTSEGYGPLSTKQQVYVSTRSDGEKVPSHSALDMEVADTK